MSFYSIILSKSHPFFISFLFFYAIISLMKKEMTRPAMKVADTKITDSDMMYFSLGIDTQEFILPSVRDDYRTDKRAIELVQAVKAGINLQGRDFSGVNLKGADISGACLKGANLSGAIFYKTTAKDCDFEGADFTEAYMEEVDFEGSDFTGANWNKIYARKLNLKNTAIDEKDLKKLTALEFLIQQIEAGNIDIRFLSKADLLHLDLRRLDLTKVDLKGIDLSAFDLEGVNLRGVYIDPNRLLSLEGLLHYYREVEKMDAKAIKTATLKFAQTKKKELQEYAKKELENADKRVYTPQNELFRPPLKDDRIPQIVYEPYIDEEQIVHSKSQQTDTNQDTDTDETGANEPKRITGQPKTTKSNLKNRN